MREERKHVLRCDERVGGWEGGREKSKRRMRGGGGLKKTGGPTRSASESLLLPAAMAPMVVAAATGSGCRSSSTCRYMEMKDIDLIKRTLPRSCQSCEIVLKRSDSLRLGRGPKIVVYC